ncbi:hypothetical protein WMY93_002223 [Mugilogobius chulae]|uniref:Uncharacterized protein n=1 Tax=Mugilogobius chulae TaxID=88201 RepID=A0AAW0PWL6_9GOBI
MSRSRPEQQMCPALNGTCVVDILKRTSVHDSEVEGEGAGSEVTAFLNESSVKQRTDQVDRPLPWCIVGELLCASGNDRTLNMRRLWYREKAGTCEKQKRRE